VINEFSFKLTLLCDVKSTAVALRL